MNIQVVYKLNSAHCTVDTATKYIDRLLIHDVPEPSLSSVIISHLQVHDCVNSASLYTVNKGF